MGHGALGLSGQGDFREKGTGRLGKILNSKLFPMPNAQCPMGRYGAPCPF
ncbi:MAG: hypothetical protein F6J93_16815 [Oscillatoria sp. SIO1A7]|nr:hypothetical protein [Oscillatoria sp. SIO1A7]